MTLTTLHLARKNLGAGWSRFPRRSLALRLAVGLWLAVMARPAWAGPALTWLQPERFAATPGATLWLDLTSAEEFAAAGDHVPVVGLQNVSGQIDGLAVPLTPPPTVPAVATPASARGPTSRVQVTLPRPGVAAFSLLLAEPQTRPASEVERYFRRIHATDDVRTAWTSLNAPRWRELRTLRLRTYVRVGEPDSADRGWSKTAAQGFDMRAERDPTTLHVNDRFAVTVARDGRPVAGVLVTFLSEGENREHVIVTGPEGRAEAILDAPGPWLIQSVDVQRAENPAYDWQTDVVALTVRTGS